MSNESIKETLPDVTNGCQLSDNGRVRYRQVKVPPRGPDKSALCRLMTRQLQAYDGVEEVRKIGRTNYATKVGEGREMVGGNREYFGKKSSSSVQRREDVVRSYSKLSSNEIARKIRVSKDEARHLKVSGRIVACAGCGLMCQGGGPSLPARHLISLNSIFL